MPDDHRVILVTGASSGIGEATALRFGSAGWQVVLAARRFERLQELAVEIESQGGQALPMATDITQPEDIQRLVQATLDRFGQIDVLFNNAGFGRFNWLEKLDPLRDIKAQLQVNLLGVILLSHAVLPHMIERRNGYIINMASIAGLVAPPTYSIYSASKFAVRGFSEALRREIGVYGIHVSVIYPGGVPTEFQGHTGAQRKTGIATPSWLRLSSRDVAEAVWKVTQRPRRTVILPGVMRLPVLLNALAPGLIDWAIERRFVKIERQI
jgi:NADP-dependent 3-hydroxy acid dehydrogenase YdfG